MDNGTTTSRLETSSPLSGILLFLCGAAITFALCSLLQSSRNTSTGYQQLLWEFTYQQKFAVLSETAKGVCQLKNVVRRNANHKNLPELKHALFLHSQNYTSLAQDYTEHLQNGLHANFVKQGDNRTLILRNIKRMACIE